MRPTTTGVSGSSRQPQSTHGAWRQPQPAVQNEMAGRWIEYVARRNALHRFLRWGVGKKAFLPLALALALGAEDKHVASNPCARHGESAYKALAACWLPKMSLAALLDAACPGSPLPPAAGTPPANRSACSELGGTGLLHTQLLVGVQSAPAHSQRRVAIRASWMQWESVGRSVVVCFLIGRDGLSAARARSLEAEAALHRDILLLDVADRVVLSLPKTFGWWQAAAALIAQGTAVRWVAKVDDDSFVHLPNLEAGLRRLHCHPHLYLGSFARCGYDPVRLTKCGFSWTGSGNYRRYGCQARGAEPPTLFALGAVQVRTQCT